MGPGRRRSGSGQGGAGVQAGSGRAASSSEDARRPPAPPPPASGYVALAMHHGTPGQDFRLRPRRAARPPVVMETRWAGSRRSGEGLRWGAAADDRGGVGRRRRRRGPEGLGTDRSPRGDTEGAPCAPWDQVRTGPRRFTRALAGKARWSRETGKSGGSPGLERAAPRRSAREDPGLRKVFGEGVGSPRRPRP